MLGALGISAIALIELGQSPWIMAVGTVGEWLKLVPFLLGDVQLIQLIQLTP